MELASGVSVSSNLTLVRPLSSGAMGSVWVAQHRAHDVPVAVKFVAKKMAKDPASRARFRREVEAATQLRSPHVVQIYENGETADGTPYLVMELLEGESLGTLLERERRIGLGRAAQVLRQVGGALDVAHARGIVHRDIKPDNVFIVKGSEPPLIKVLDFGMAKQVRIKDGSIITATGVAVGTPQYMSPEQVLGQKDVDYRSDLWALGVVAYRMLAGGLPFQAPNPHALTFKICKGEFSPLAEVGVPSDLTRWFERALAPNKDKRFGSAREMVLRFESTVASLPEDEPGLSFSDEEESTQFFDKHKLMGQSLALPLSRPSGSLEPEPSTERQPATIDEESTAVDDSDEQAPTQFRYGRGQLAAIRDAVSAHGDPTGGEPEPVAASSSGLDATVPMEEMSADALAALRRVAESADVPSSGGSATPSSSSLPSVASATSTPAPSSMPEERRVAHSLSGEERVPQRPAPASPADGSLGKMVMGFVLAGVVAAGAFLAMRRSADDEAPGEVEVASDAAGAEVPPVDAAAETSATEEATRAEVATTVDPEAPSTRGSLDESGVGTLSVLCTPGCSDVRIDGRSYGPSPVYGREVPAGEHALMLHQEHGPSRRVTVRVIAGQEKVENVAMVRALKPPPRPPAPKPSVAPPSSPPQPTVAETTEIPPSEPPPASPPPPEAPPAQPPAVQPPAVEPPPDDQPPVAPPAPEVGTPDFD